MLILIETVLTLRALSYPQALVSPPVLTPAVIALHLAPRVTLLLRLQEAQDCALWQVLTGIPVCSPQVWRAASGKEESGVSLTPACRQSVGCGVWLHRCAV